MTNLEEFFKNRIIFNLHEECRSSLFVPHQQKFRYISNNIFTPEKYSLKFLKQQLKLLHTICLVVIF